MSPRRRWLLVPAAFGVLLVSLVTALAGVLVHGHWWGLALTWLTGCALLRALPGSWWGRPVFVLGWVVVLAGVLLPRPEGDFLVASTPQGYLLLASAVVFVPVAAVGLSNSSRASRRR